MASMAEILFWPLMANIQQDIGLYYTYWLEDF